MTPLCVFVSRVADGRELPLGGLREVSITASLASPARAVRLTAAVEAHPGELGAVRVEQAGQGLFTGSCDREVFSLSAAGRTLTVEARSRGARLLDNEAQPCTLFNLRLSTAFERFIAPYGFALSAAGSGGSLGIYTVHKGQSEWEAFSAFCRGACGVTPYVRGSTVVVGPPADTPPLVIGTAGLPYTQLRQVFEPYSILSRVVLRDAAGNYSAAAPNSAAQHYNIRRQRYSIPSSEFTGSPGLDANQRIRHSMQSAYTTEVTLPGIIPAEPGCAVRIADDALYENGLLAGEVTWRQGAEGITTTLVLLRAAYY